MITIYSNTETTFTHNGLGVINPSVCYITEELNGLYELELSHPIDDRGKWENIVNDNIIKADGQLFRIYKVKRNLTSVYAYARHIFYDLLDNFIEDANPTDLNGAGALSWVFARTQYAHSFTTMSDIETTNTANYIKINPVQAIFDEKIGMLTKWNAELVRDNFVIELLGARGSDKGVTIRYKKNLLGIEDDSDLDTVITRIMPIGYEGLMLPEKYIDSPYINNYSRPKIRVVEFKDIKIDPDNGITEADAINLLRATATEWMTATKCDLPAPNYKVNFQELSKTQEYKNYAVLQTIYIGDTITVKHEKLGLDLKAKFIKYKKDVLKNRYENIELGELKKTIATTIEKGVKDVAEDIELTKTHLQSSLDNATDYINSALGGHVVKRNGELLIMDTEDVNTAQVIAKWNINGLEFGNQGVSGPSTVAITRDGHIIADFVDTGILDASIVKTGLLQSKDGSSWINMDNGSFSLGGGRMSLIGGVFSLNYAGTPLATAIEGKASKAYTDALGQYLTFDQTVGLTLSEYASKFKINITNAQINFIDNGSTVAWINGQKMYITNLQATNSLIVGKHLIEKFATGNLTLIKYVGDGV